MFELCFSKGVRTPYDNSIYYWYRHLRAGALILNRRIIEILNNVVQVSLTSKTCLLTQRYMPGICMPGQIPKWWLMLVRYIGGLPQISLSSAITYSYTPWASAHSLWAQQDCSDAEYNQQAHGGSYGEHNKVRRLRPHCEVPRRTANDCKRLQTTANDCKRLQNGCKYCARYEDDQPSQRRRG